MARKQRLRPASPEDKRPDYEGVLLELELGFTDYKVEDVKKAVERMEQIFENVKGATWFVKIAKSKKYLLCNCLSTTNIDIRIGDTSIKGVHEDGAIYDGIVYSTANNLREILAVKELVTHVNAQMGYTSTHHLRGTYNNTNDVINAAAALPNHYFFRHQTLYNLFEKGKGILTENQRQYGHDGFYKIIEVVTKHNDRYVLMQEQEYSTKYDNILQKNEYILDDEYTVILSNPERKEYNYLDEGRICLVNDTHILLFGMDMTPELMEHVADYKIRNKLLSDDKIYFETQEIRELIDEDELEIKREEQSSNQRQVMIDTMTAKLKQSGVTVNGITITSGGIFSYGGLTCGGGIPWDTFMNAADLVDEELDFNNIYYQYATYLSQHIKYQPRDTTEVSDDARPIYFQGGYFKNKLHKVRKVAGYFYYVNDIRINAEELEDVIRQSICFNTREEYNKMLADVSKISIKIHNILNTGLILNMHSNYQTDTVPIKLVIIRKSGKHHLQISGKDYRISNIRVLASKCESHSRYRTAYTYTQIKEVLKSVIFDLGNDAIKEIIRDGAREYREAVKRSEELLAQAVKTVGATRSILQHTGQYDNNKNGWIVKGKLREYFITDDLKVYDNSTKKYICIVDNDRLQRVVGKDRLVSRIYALANDSLLAATGQIDTLKY